MNYSVMYNIHMHFFVDFGGLVGIETDRGWCMGLRLRRLGAEHVFDSFDFPLGNPFEVKSEFLLTCLGKHFLN